MHLLSVHSLPVALIGSLVQKLAVAEPVHDKDSLLNLHRLLHVHRLRPILNAGPSRHGKLLPDGRQILLYHRIHMRSASEDFLIFLNPGQRGLVLLLQGQNLQANELVEPHFQDSRSLALGKMQLFRVLLKAQHPKADFRDVPGHQAGLGIL